MSKEHSGGVDNGGLFRVPAEWHEDQRHAVRIENFDFSKVDSFDDLVREEIALTGSARRIFDKMLALEASKVRGEVVIAVLSEIIQAKDPRQACLCLAIASGMMLTAEKSGPAHAKDLGLSKQDIQQGVEFYRRKFGLRKTRTTRDEKSRDLMRQANYRPNQK
jgi:hypothetical protein